LLEAQGLVSKEVAADKKSKFTYRLTEKGIDLLPLIVEFTLWGARYSPAGGNAGLLRELADDPDDVTVVATGGLAPLVLEESHSIDVHEPWLTLIGLRLVFERNVG